MDALFFAGFVTGVLDTCKIRFPENVATGATFQIVADFLKAHPEERHKSGWSLVKFAVEEKFSNSQPQ